MRILRAIIEYAMSTYRTPNGKKVMTANPVDVLRESSMLRSVKPHVYDEIEARMRERVHQLSLEADRVVFQAAMQAYFDARGLAHPDGQPKQLHELDPVTAQVVQVETTQKEGEKPVLNIRDPERSHALEKLAKYHGLYHRDNQQRGGEIAELLRAISASSGVLDDARERSK